jgi:hypothetical protein
MIGSNSPASVPKNTDHAVCLRRNSNDFWLLEIPSSVQESLNGSWIGHHKGNCFCGSENDVATVVKTYLLSFLKPLGIRIRICTEMGIQNIRPDILILEKDSILVGVVDVKKPGDTLTNANVLGELYDQMSIVKCFYGTGPTLGLLTDGHHVVVAWFNSFHTFIFSFD